MKKIPSPVKIFNRFFDCNRLWCADISHRQRFPEKTMEGYTFMVIESNGEMERMKTRLAQGRGEKYIHIIDRRIENGTYNCFVFLHDQTGDVAYTRWSCRERFYSDPMRKELRFDHDEILTLNSYTLSAHRMKGLHREMNVRMLNYLMQHTGIRKVYMVINCFIRHLTKIPGELGYRPVETRIYLKFLRV